MDGSWKTITAMIGHCSGTKKQHNPEGEELYPTYMGIFKFMTTALT